ncbi:MAG: hypothetical protein RMK89_04275 [Armatimonadota bacterium]|nr:hypothetical protein [Armatimonadota bacterium]MCX7642876.1 hypothetical protein [Armatimonadota bacterium]MDW8142663.1 hypothetical protein [Armatimonadota bacterium]
MIFRFGDDGLAIAMRHGIINESHLRQIASWWGKVVAGVEQLRKALLEVEMEDKERWIEAQVEKLRLMVFDRVLAEGDIDAAIKLLQGYDSKFRGKGGVQVNILQQRLQYRSPITGQVVELEPKEQKALTEGES